MRRKNPISHSYAIIALSVVILVAGSFMAYLLFVSGSDSEMKSSDTLELGSDQQTDVAEVKPPKPIILHGSYVEIQPAGNISSVTQ